MVFEFSEIMKSFYGKRSPQTVHALEKFVAEYMVSQRFQNDNPHVEVHILADNNIKIVAPNHSFYLSAIYNVQAAFDSMFIPAEDVYYKILNETDFDKRITHKEFIRNIKECSTCVSYMDKCDDSFGVHYYIRRSAVKGFIAHFYGDIYDGVLYYQYGFSSHLPKGPADFPHVEFYEQKSGSMPHRIVSFAGKFKNYMEPKDDYDPTLSKIVNLRSLAITLIKNQLKLVEERNAGHRTPGREEKIKEKMMNTVDILATQSEYIKKYFNKDIKVLVERYRSGDWMTIDEVLKFFDMQKMTARPESIHEPIR